MRFRLHNIPMPRTAEGDRLRELIRKVYPQPNLPPLDYRSLELRVMASVVRDEVR